jgi:hypothetical protein
MVLTPKLRARNYQFRKFVLHTKLCSSNMDYNRRECEQAGNLAWNPREVWPTVAVNGQPKTLADVLTLLDASNSARIFRGTENVVARMPFEVPTMRHVPIRILHLIGSRESGEPEARIRRMGAWGKWQIVTQNDIDRLVCTCKNVHAWYYGRFRPESIREHATFRVIGGRFEEILCAYHERDEP